MVFWMFSGMVFGCFLVMAIFGLTLVLLKVIFEFWPYLRAFWGNMSHFFLGF